MSNETKTELLICGDSLLKGTMFNQETGNFESHNFLDSIPGSVNLSKFGCTVTKGADYIKKIISKYPDCRYVLMDFGGNDSDYIWNEISSDPQACHSPRTTVEVFTSTYVELIHFLKEKGITPVLTTLCPIYNVKYFDYFCKSMDCDPVNVMLWLKDIKRLGENQNRYSEIVKQIAEQEQVPLIDIRKAFTNFPDYTKLLCDDGIHPNQQGQTVLLNCIKSFFLK